MPEMNFKINNELVIPLKYYQKELVRATPEEILQNIVKFFDKVIKVFLSVVKDGTVTFEDISLKCPKCGRDEMESNIIGSGKIFGFITVTIYLKILLDETCGLYYWRFSFKK